MPPIAANTNDLFAVIAQITDPERDLKAALGHLHLWLADTLGKIELVIINGDQDRVVYNASIYSEAQIFAAGGLHHYLSKGQSGINFGQAQMMERIVNRQLDLDHPTPNSWLALPWGGVRLDRGAIMVFSDRTAKFPPEQFSLMETVADALEQAFSSRHARQELLKLKQQQQQVNQQLQQQQNLLSVQHQIALLSGNPLPLNELCRQFHEQFKALLPCHNFYVALLSQDDKWIEFPYIIDQYQPLLTKRRQLGDGITEYLLRTQKPLLLNQQQRQALVDNGEATQMGHPAKSWMGAPLFSDDNVIGAVVIQDYQQEQRYSEQDLKMLSYLAHHIANVLIIRQAHKALSDNQQALEGAVNERTLALQHEIAERRRIESQLRHDNLHDHLTGLPNRALLLQRLEQLFARQKRDPSYQYALLYLDLDRFKMVNDSLGHLTGDNLLTQVSARLKRCLRGTDTVARLGGDEFAIILDNIHTNDDAKTTANRIHKMLSQPFLINKEEIYSGASIGIAYCDENYESPQAILRDADVAMYQSKARGGQPIVFSAAMRKEAQRRLRLETELTRAIEQQQFVVHYQPVWRLDSKQLVGFEALVRWNHPERGLLMPVQFIEVMEETKQILELDRWVMQHACRQFAHWQKKYPRMSEISISVNLSSEWFSRQNSLDIINTTLKQSGLPAKSLRLEITERSLLGQHEQATIILHQIRRLGVRLAMDDFGTGYSSLNYLHRLPLDIVKIDRSFTSQIHVEQRAKDVVQAIVHLASALNMKVNAEGIDNIQQIEILREMGCDFGQGFQLGKPMPSERVPQFVSGKTAAADAV